jgi:S1-C subfamily serine protease
LEKWLGLLLLKPQRTDMNQEGVHAGGDESHEHTRRAVLAAVSGVSMALAGCSTAGRPTSENETTRAARQSESPVSAPFTDVYQDIIDSVVVVFGYNEGGRVGQGSGFLAFDDIVVTNQHVIADTDDLVVGFSDGTTTTGELLGSDIYSDLAAIELAEPPEDDGALQFVSREPPVGTEVLVVGAPFGLGESASTGIVSGVDRPLPSPTGFSVPDTVQTDAAVNPGNSGGPLTTKDGQVVGVINSGGGENIAFGISAALVKRVIPTLIETGEYQHSFIGVGLNELTPPLVRANAFGRSTGVYVTTVVPDGPADGTLQGSDDESEALGVQAPTGGDLIVGLDGRAIQSLGDLSTHLALRTSPGDILSLSLIRDGERREVSMTLGARPDP